MLKTRASVYNLSGTPVRTRCCRRIDMNENGQKPQSLPLPLTFEGRAEDYFAIWIVNLLFTVLTIGAYSAWAKVRRLQFFYGNSRLAGDGFSYLARPIVLLRARVLVLAVLLLYFATFWVSPLAGLLLTFGFIPVYPWIIHRSLRFNSRMTAWRNVRFDWHGTYPQAFRVFVLWPVVSVLTLGIAFPLAARAVREYLANGQAFGHARFSVRTGVAEYYLAAGGDASGIPFRWQHHCGGSRHCSVAAGDRIGV